MIEVKAKRAIPESADECANLRCRYCVFDCPSHAGNIFHEMEQMFDEDGERIIKRILIEIKNAYINGKIEVNDGDDEYGQGKEYKIRGIGDKKYFYANLVVEEDGSIRWYFNPARSDHIICGVEVLPQCDEQWALRTGG